MNLFRKSSHKYQSNTLRNRSYIDSRYISDPLLRISRSTRDIILSEFYTYEFQEIDLLMLSTYPCHNIYIKELDMYYDKLLQRQVANLRKKISFADLIHYYTDSDYDCEDYHTIALVVRNYTPKILNYDNLILR